MIGYITLGTNDLARAAAFYDALLADLGGTRMMEFERGIIWSAGPQSPGIGLLTPFNGEPATIGNGVMVGLAADSREKVDQIYRRALALGGTDEGAAGPRGDGFYAGYFRDPDGNKLDVFFMG